MEDLQSEKEKLEKKIVEEEALLATFVDQIAELKEKLAKATAAEESEPEVVSSAFAKLEGLLAGLQTAGTLPQEGHGWQAAISGLKVLLAEKLPKPEEPKKEGQGEKPAEDEKKDSPMGGDGSAGASATAAADEARKRSAKPPSDEQLDEIVQSQHPEANLEDHKLRDDLRKKARETWQLVKRQRL